MTRPVYIGTSGWSYPHWRESFYKGVPQKDWLHFNARHFNSVEINASFYRLQKPATFQRWHDETPDDFRFSLKANRYITHNKKLKDPAKSIRIERIQSLALRDKLAVVLWQLPPTFKIDMRRLEKFCEALELWSEVNHTIEFRHASWFTDEAADCLAVHNIAVCQSDAADWTLWETVTAGLVYIRLHGHTRTYVSGYRIKTLERWAKKIKALHKKGISTYVYFDNDAKANAPRDAKKLITLVDQ